MKEYEEKTCLYALNKIYGHNPRIARTMVEQMGGAAECFKDGGKPIREALPYTEGTEKINDEQYLEAEKELRSLENQGYSFLCFTDKDFPAALKECPDCPMGIYIRSGSPVGEIFDDSPFVSIVGTRDMSPYGKDWCRRIVATLSKCRVKCVIVSGLAIGVDITAHRAALDCGLRTIAVLPSGITSVYPSRHFYDAKRIAETAGCALITDFPPNTPPLRPYFLRRNRIIAGLSSATILVESQIKGGGMMTANQAFSYDRTVLAVPGRIDEIRSQGCNYLIRNKVAEPIISEESIIESLDLDLPALKKKNPLKIERIVQHLSRSFSDEDIELLARIILIIRRHSGIDIEMIAQELELPYSRTCSLVSCLEADGIITTDLMRRCVINIS